ncbi:MAG TPA: VOC family protein [Phenylobacterium sp.]|uniref:VOC family protein n=1 Tax=Phenylobacterium sp. TaxID=1871053 RepID=UPI002B45FFB9|nr:VOC family protein [Phenylobacterium sp.]HKR86801.1 VOC family protein [Phenylobacterium sp.]
MSQAKVDMKLEVVVIPVTDVDRAAEFYAGLGWRKDADLATPTGGRILQFTPPGSPCSILFGTGLTPAAPGSAQFVHLIVSDIEAARADLVEHGVAASEVFHDRAGGYNRFDPAARATGPDPQRRSYASFVTFEDPDGNGWILQEITTRFPGRIDTSTTAFSSVTDLANAMRRASAAHGEHEKRIGAADPEGWPDWYAAYMVAEQSGADLPS